METQEVHPFFQWGITVLLRGDQGVIAIGKVLTDEYTNADKVKTYRKVEMITLRIFLEMQLSYRHCLQQKSKYTW